MLELHVRNHIASDVPVVVMPVTTGFLSMGAGFMSAVVCSDSPGHEKTEPIAYETRGGQIDVIRCKI